MLYFNSYEYALNYFSSYETWDKSKDIPQYKKIEKSTNSPLVNYIVAMFY
jgi:hypothetical protein